MVTMTIVLGCLGATLSVLAGTRFATQREILASTYAWKINVVFIGWLCASIGLGKSGALAFR